MMLANVIQKDCNAFETCGVECSLCQVGIRVHMTHQSTIFGGHVFILTVTDYFTNGKIAKVAIRLFFMQL